MSCKDRDMPRKSIMSNTTFSKPMKMKAHNKLVLI